MAVDHPSDIGTAGAPMDTRSQERATRGRRNVTGRDAAGCWMTAVVLAWFATDVVPARRAFAACNLIPQTAIAFDGVLGSANRPFAAPGEPIEVRVRPCDTSSAGISAAAANNI